MTKSTVSESAISNKNISNLYLGKWLDSYKNNRNFSRQTYPITIFPKIRIPAHHGNIVFVQHNLCALLS